jgi:hypothetical protein
MFSVEHNTLTHTMTTNMEHLQAYLHLEQYLRDLQNELGQDLMLDYLALAIEQLDSQKPRLRRVA